MVGNSSGRVTDGLLRFIGPDRSTTLSLSHNRHIMIVGVIKSPPRYDKITPEQVSSTTYSRVHFAAMTMGLFMDSHKVSEK